MVICERGSDFPCWGAVCRSGVEKPPADGKGILAWVEGSTGGTPCSSMQRVVLALPLMLTGRVSAWCWRRSLQGQMFFGENSTEAEYRKQVHVCDAYFSPWEKRYCLLSIVVSY